VHNIVVEMPSVEVHDATDGAKHSMRLRHVEKPPMLKYAPDPEERIGKISSNIPCDAATAQSPPPQQQARSSPAPMQNGKPSSPYVRESSPMGPGGHTVSSKDPKAAAAAAMDMRNVVRRKLTGYVGFANLPNQWHRKSVRKGFSFNVMVVGTSR